MATDTNTSVWDGKAMTKLLESYDFGTAFETVWIALEEGVVECADFIRGNSWYVPLAYLNARNQLFISRGAMTTEQLKEALVSGIFVLARVAQDVDACYNTLSQPRVEHVLQAFFNKVFYWFLLLSSRTKGPWPPLEDVVETVRSRLRDMTIALPSPIWVPFFSQSILPMRSHMYFKTPDEAIIVSATRVSRQINTERQKSLRCFLTAVKNFETWESFLKCNLEQLRIFDEKQEEEEEEAVLPLSPIAQAVVESSTRVRQRKGRMLLRRV